MPRPSASTHGIADIAAFVAVLVGIWIGKELALQVAVIGLLDLIAAGATLLAIVLGRRVLAPGTSWWRARRRKAYIEVLRDSFCTPGRARHLPMISPCISSDQGDDPPRPFDPQAAARFLRLLESGDPDAALRGAGLRECDVLAWLAAGLNPAPDGEPLRVFAMQVLDFIRRPRSLRRPMLCGEPQAPMLDGVAHPERRHDELIVRPFPGR
jgi:hypothetical protein